MHLTYGAFKRYGLGQPTGCPERFRRQNIEKEWPEESNHWAIFGSVLQAVFEHFYKDEMWRHPDTVQQELIDSVPDRMSEFLEKRFVDWNAPHFEEDEFSTQEDIERHIPPVLQAIVDFGLLGHRNLSEYYIKAPTGKSGKHSFGGQIDFLIYRGNDILIVDGKGGKKGPKEFKTTGKYKYISTDQLHYYATAYAKKTGKYPTHLAFLWYRFAEETDDGFDTTNMWDELHWTKGDLSEMFDRIVETIRAIGREEFDAKPSPKACDFCPFTAPGPGQCQDYKHWNLNERKRRKKKRSFEVNDDGTVTF